MDWSRLWLGYERIEGCEEERFFRRVYYRSGGSITENAVCELKAAVTLCLGFIPDLLVKRDGETNRDWEPGIILETAESSDLGKEGYQISQEADSIFITGGSEAGMLYGVWHLLRLLRCGRKLTGLQERNKPDNPLRMLNHWDNSDGTIERGYSGRSFFFEDGRLKGGERIKEYARLISSVGINGVVINNVNVKGAATEFITKKYLGKLKEYADCFSGYGIRLFLSLNFASPIELGELETADPLDESVISWWSGKMDEVYREIPSLGGFLVKADSEGRPGPFTYGRNHAEGANMLARAVRPHGGLIIWRCFVYNCRQDWRDRKTDRARSGYDNFKPLDGLFDDNVILQIKNGPMDFQVREPVSPLLGGLTKTNCMLEFQLAQEYTGQQKHVCYLLPMFREVLAFKTYAASGNDMAADHDTVADIVSGKTFGQTNCGIAAVANTGDDDNWTGHDLAAANLYGYGRLCFDTSLDAGELADEWIRQTFSCGEEAVWAIKKILLNSWPAYEKYTSPLGIGWMVNPGYHYGPNVDGYEYDRWGTYHRADHRGIGVERGPEGTGYTGQYREPNASRFAEISTCPEELLLFFHYIPYTYRLTSGKTLIQHIYDTHFEGVRDVEEMIRIWEGLEGKLPQDAYDRVRERLAVQLMSAEEWRDIVNSYFYRKSGIEEEQGRQIY